MTSAVVSGYTLIFTWDMPELTGPGAQPFIQLQVSYVNLYRGFHPFATHHVITGDFLLGSSLQHRVQICTPVHVLHAFSETCWNIA
jgi:hypothetical protein